MNKSKIKINLSHPFILFFLVWALTLFFYSLEITNNILGLNKNTRILLYSFFFIYFFVNIISNFLQRRVHEPLIYKLSINSKIEINLFTIIINKIFKIWVFFSILEIILFKGVPLISVVIFKNSDVDYAKFGLPTLHGLLNALYYTFMVGNFLVYSLTKQKKYLIKIIIFIFWPILLMSRASFLWVVAEILCVYLLLNKIYLKKFLILCFYVIVFIYLFGVLGDARIGENSSFKTSNFVSTKYENIAEKIPSGFIWVYLYATTPINNIVVQTNQLNPKYDFKSSTAGLIPSVIRSRIYNEDDKYGFELDSQAFNVSSFFSNFLNDFGIIGTLIIVTILFILSLLIYYKCFTGKLGYIISYSAIFYAILTSIFFDNFLSLVTIFQITLGIIINNLLYKNKKINYNV